MKVQVNRIAAHLVKTPIADASSLNEATTDHIVCTRILFGGDNTLTIKFQSQDTSQTRPITVGPAFRSLGHRYKSRPICKFYKVTSCIKNREEQIETCTVKKTVECYAIVGSIT